MRCNDKDGAPIIVVGHLEEVDHKHSPNAVGQALQNHAKGTRVLFQDAPQTEFLQESHLLHRAQVDRCHGMLHRQDRIQEHMWAIPPGFVI